MYVHNVLFKSHAIIYVLVPHHVELASCISLIHCTIGGCMPCAIYNSQGFWFCTLPSPFKFEGVKLLAALIIDAQWCKFHDHILFQSKVIEFLYVTTQRQQGIVSLRHYLYFSSVLYDAVL